MERSRSLTRSSIDYYNSVVKVVGRATDVRNSYRLFMVPGMGHCFGGEGPTMSIRLVRWSDGSKKEERRIG